MKIANIFSRNNIEVPEDFNVTDSMDNIIHGIPTLIVGYDYVKKHYPDFDITNRCIKDDLCWIFKKTERRDDFNSGLEWFINKTYSDLCQNVKYVYVDFIQYNDKVLLKIIKKIISLKDKVSFHHKDMIYIYGENLIFGIDLKLLSFMEKNVNSIKDKIKLKSSVFLGDSDILIDRKNIVDESHIGVRYIPYLYYIRNEQKNTISSLHIPRKA